MMPETKSWVCMLLIINSFYPELRTVSLHACGFLSIVLNVPFYSVFTSRTWLTLRKLFLRAGQCLEQKTHLWLYLSYENQTIQTPYAIAHLQLHISSDSYTPSQHSPASTTPCSGTRQLRTVPAPQRLLKWFGLTNPNLPTLPHGFFFPRKPQ